MLKNVLNFLDNAIKVRFNLLKRNYKISFYSIESLAYVMAATHGLDEQAEQLRESLDDKVIYYAKNRTEMSIAAEYLPLPRTSL
jgi:hypothetical protein